MTVIVWDGTTLAADRRAISAGYNYPVTKLARVGDRLVGFAGCMDRFGAFKDWLAAGRPADKYPPRDNEGGWWTALVIDRAGRIERFESGVFPIIVEQRYHAIGSGRDFAIAAIHLGHDARKAVEVASVLCCECGDGVDTLTFESSNGEAPITNRIASRYII